MYSLSDEFGNRSRRWVFQELLRVFLFIARSLALSPVRGRGIRVKGERSPESHLIESLTNAVPLGHISGFDFDVVVGCEKQLVKMQIEYQKYRHIPNTKILKYQ